MLSYRLKSRKSIESKNPKVVKIKNRGIMLLSKCAVCKKLTFYKKQEVRGALSNFLRVEVRILSDIPILNTTF